MRDEEGDETIKHSQLQQATIDGTIPTAIVDSGALLTCLKIEQQQVSECGKYQWKPPFTSTGQRSNKVFAMALGNTAAASEIVQGEAACGHTIPGLQNNLLSMNVITKEGYVPIFDGDKLSIYDAHTT